MAENPMYHDGMRQLQDERDTRRLADRLARVTVRAVFTDEDRAFIGRCAMVFVATADTHGNPDCSYKGGLPGFVGVLFVDFERQKRLRVNGTAEVGTDDPLRSECPGAVFIVRVTAERIFPNCPRYIHKMQLVEHSVYAPRPEYTPPV